MCWQNLIFTVVCPVYQVTLAQRLKNVSSCCWGTPLVDPVSYEEAKNVVMASYRTRGLWIVSKSSITVASSHSPLLPPSASPPSPSVVQWNTVVASIRLCWQAASHHSQTKTKQMSMSLKRQAASHFPSTSVLWLFCCSQQLREQVWIIGANATITRYAQTSLFKEPLYSEVVFGLMVGFFCQPVPSPYIKWQTHDIMPWDTPTFKLIF